MFFIIELPGDFSGDGEIYFAVFTVIALHASHNARFCDGVNLIAFNTTYQFSNL